MSIPSKVSHLRAVETPIIDSPKLANDGGGPHDPDMETRIAILEHKVDGLDKRVGELDTRVAALDATVRSESRELRSEFNRVLTNFSADVNNNFREVRSQASTQFFRLCLLILGGFVIAIAGKALGWL